MKSMLAAIDFNPILAPVLEVLNAILWPAIGLVGSIGMIYCIVLGVKLAKADEAFKICVDRNEFSNKVMVVMWYDV